MIESAPRDRGTEMIVQRLAGGWTALRSNDRLTNDDDDGDARARCRRLPESDSTCVDGVSRGWSVPLGRSASSARDWSGGAFSAEAVDVRSPAPTRLVDRSHHLATDPSASLPRSLSFLASCPRHTLSARRIVRRQPNNGPMLLRKCRRIAVVGPYCRAVVTTDIDESASGHKSTVSARRR